MSNPSFKLFSPYTATVFLLVAAYIALPKIELLSPFFQELVYYAPYAILTFAGLLSLRFGRSRVVCILSAIGLAYLGFSYYLKDGQDSFSAKVIFHTISILLPLNLLIFIALRERKLLSLSRRFAFWFYSAASGCCRLGNTVQTKGCPGVCYTRNFSKTLFPGNICFTINPYYHDTEFFLYWSQYILQKYTN